MGIAQADILLYDPVDTGLQINGVDLIW